jgi:hypothetical protein
MKKCIDCLKEMKDSEHFEIENACDSCAAIRKNMNRCWICGVMLKEDNSWINKEDGQKELTCIACAKKFNEYPDAEFFCPTCSSLLEQDPENLFELWCPKCLDKKAVLV